MDIPIINIRSCGGSLIPQNVFLDIELNNVVRKTIEDVYYWTKKNHCSIHYQQLFVSVIPIRQMECSSGSDIFNVIVYGNDKKVICDDFPCRFGCLKRIFSKKKGISNR